MMKYVVTKTQIFEMTVYAESEEDAEFDAVEKQDFEFVDEEYSVDEVGDDESIWTKRMGHRVVFDVRKIEGSDGKCDYYDAVVLNRIVGSGGEELVLLGFGKSVMIWTRVVGNHLETSDKAFCVVYVEQDGESYAD